MSLPYVSVVLPTFNRAATLRRAIDSVLQQSLSSLELIVVDDASTDGTSSVLSAIADPRLQVVRHDHQAGGSAARNTGIARARAGLVAFQDSDDEWMPTKLVEQTAMLERAGDEFAASYTGLVEFGHDTARYIPGPEIKNREGDILTSLLWSNFVSTQTLMVRTAVLKDVGGFDETLPRYQDWDIALRLAQKTRFAFVNRPLSVVYQTPGNISSRPDFDLIARAKILDKYSDLYRNERASLARHHHILARIAIRLGHVRQAKQHSMRAVMLNPRQLKYLAAAVDSYRWRP